PTPRIIWARRRPWSTARWPRASCAMAARPLAAVADDAKEPLSREGRGELRGSRARGLRWGPPDGVDHDSNLLASIPYETVGQVKALHDLKEGLILVELVAFVVEELVKDDDGARHEAGDRELERALGRGVDVAVDVHE